MSLKNFRVLADRVMVQLDAKKENVTESGIIIPVTVNNNNVKGVVIKVGEKCQNINEGNQVIIDPSNFSNIEIDSIGYIIGRENDIAAIFD